jgi:hypothetical protein
LTDLLVAEPQDRVKPPCEPTRAVLVSVLGPSSNAQIDDPGDERVPTGTSVEVRTRYVPGHWAHGYEVAESLPKGYRIRRCGSKEVLSEVFADADVRPLFESMPDPAPVSVKRPETDLLKIEPECPVRPSIRTRWLGQARVIAHEGASTIAPIGRSVGVIASNVVVSVRQLPGPLASIRLLRRVPQEALELVLGEFAGRVEALALSSDEVRQDWNAR